jgi:hypothetical protein
MRREGAGRGTVPATESCSSRRVHRGQKRHLIRNIGEISPVRVRGTRAIRQARVKCWVRHALCHPDGLWRLWIWVHRKEFGWGIERKVRLGKVCIGGGLGGGGGGVSVQVRLAMSQHDESRIQPRFTLWKPTAINQGDGNVPLAAFSNCTAISLARASSPHVATPAGSPSHDACPPGGNPCPPHEQSENGPSHGTLHDFGSSLFGGRFGCWLNPTRAQKHTVSFKLPACACARSGY